MSMNDISLKIMEATLNANKPSLKSMEIESGLAEIREIDFDEPAPVEYVEVAVI